MGSNFTPIIYFAPFIYIANELDFNQHQATTSDVTELIFTVGGDDDDVCVSKSYQVVVPSELNPSHQVSKKTSQYLIEYYPNNDNYFCPFFLYSILEQ